MKGTHTCEISIKRNYTITTNGRDSYIYDPRNHSYLFNISYCPFCGVAL